MVDCCLVVWLICLVAWLLLGGVLYFSVSVDCLIVIS